MDLNVCSGLCVHEVIRVCHVLCCDASRFCGCVVGQSCVYGVPFLILVVWCERLCFEGFCRLC